MPEHTVNRTIRGSRTTARSRRTLRNGWFTRLRAIAATPSLIPLLAVFAGFVLVVSLVVGTTRTSPVLAIDRVMDRTHVARVGFSVLDEEQTRSKRDLARARAPRVFNADRAVFERLENTLRTLPTVLATTETLEDVNPDIRQAFKLTQEQFDALRLIASDPTSVTQWEQRAVRFVSLLRRIPLLSSQEFQDAIQEEADLLELRGWEGAVESLLPKSSALNIETVDEASTRRIEAGLLAIAADAGLPGPLGQAAVQRVLSERKRTYLFDRRATEALIDEEVSQVQPVTAAYRPGDVIYQRGRVLSEKARELAMVENAAYRQTLATTSKVWQWAGVIGLVATVTAALAGYVGLFYQSMLTSAWRAFAVAAMLACSVATACWGVQLNPAMAWIGALGPPVFVGMVLVIAYDRRLALAAAAGQALLIAVALNLSVGYLVTSMVGAALTAWQLTELRHRRDLVRTTVVLTAGLAIAVLVVSILERPTVDGVVPRMVIREIIADAAKAGLAGFTSSALTVLVLPGVERLFDVVTGLKLSELRDPKQPLLRLLQQRAPGTYNHSLTVASIAEAAAESIGANGLHVYVGALYHDVGKMNKPDYFVENQVGGVSRHSRLSPAMSLLVIVGHVKDGVELAREYKLPFSLHHYIETHHGTTLVEYFFDQARKAAGDENEAPDEVEYRYPGPKPRTKEAAILMLSDAIESATRALPEPTPSRIAALVHALATKRLMDGQFDECNLTLRELHTVEEAITRTLNSIYHGRIAYPREATEAPKAAEMA